MPVNENVGYKGLFVTFEGIDGVGKTTLLQNVAKILHEDEHQDVLKTKEPGDKINGELIGSDIGPGIRQLCFFDPTSHNMAPGVADLLFLADHIQVTEKVIKPAMAAGKIILCDRYADSQFAYSVQKTTPAYANEWYENRFTFLPDMTFLVICDPTIAWSRSKARVGAESAKQEGKAWKGVEAQTAIQNAYLERLAPLPRTTIVDMMEFTDDPLAAAEFVVDDIMERLEHQIFGIAGSVNG